MHLFDRIRRLAGAVGCGSRVYAAGGGGVGGGEEEAGCVCVCVCVAVVEVLSSLYSAAVLVPGRLCAVERDPCTFFVSPCNDRGLCQKLSVVSYKCNCFPGFQGLPPA